MTDKPILFSGPMVRAILEGRKSQTRRVLHQWKSMPAPHSVVLQNNTCVCRWLSGARQDIAAPKKEGDRLWVREAWSGQYVFKDTPPSKREDFAWEGIPYFKEDIWYWADGSPEFGDWERGRPSIHMPKWASRLTLLVTDVRVERLQDISMEDAIAEGCSGYVSKDGEDGESPQEQFHDLWNSINTDSGKTWEDNPWVACYSFDVIHSNIDMLEAA